MVRALRKDFMQCAQAAHRTQRRPLGSYVKFNASYATHHAYLRRVKEVSTEIRALRSTNV